MVFHLSYAIPWAEFHQYFTRKFTGGDIKLLFFFYRKKKLVVSINKNNNKESLCFCILKMFFKNIENLLFIFVLIFFMFSDHFDI
jgi:glycerol uptake facilitator-like aquaporin